MIVFTEYGFSPANFKALVVGSGVKSNIQFMRDNNMSKATFYRYASGETSLSWHDWQALADKYGFSVKPAHRPP